MDIEQGHGDLTEIDRQINEARQRQVQRGEDPGEQPDAPSKRQGRKRLTAEEKAERDAEQTEEKARRKAEREAERARRREEKAANARPAHMLKVEKAAERLPELPEKAKTLFDAFTREENVDLSALEALVAHLNHFVRIERTKLALQTQVSVGQVVEITGGDARFIGRVGTVERVQRIRCYVSIDSHTKAAYLFTSDVRPLSGQASVIEQGQAAEKVPEAQTA